MLFDGEHPAGQNTNHGFLTFDCLVAAVRLLSRETAAQSSPGMSAMPTPERTSIPDHLK
jgi:hypothetical protein